MRYITTSWDDGHPSDERLAGLLGKYNLKGTFYIPQVNPGHRVMNEKEIANLSRNFEVGGHTLGHVNLKRLPAEKAKKEIEGSYNWLTAVSGTAPVSFCPPFGAYLASASLLADPCRRGSALSAPLSCFPSVDARHAPDDLAGLRT